MTDTGPGELTEDEVALKASLPRPPRIDDVLATHVWMIEWPDDDGDGGATVTADLRQRLEARCPGWTRHIACRGRNDIVSAIKAAERFAREERAKPILHLEAGGDGGDLEGPGPDGTRERIAWAELAPHLCRLNAATGCQLVLVCADGRGVAARLTAAAGERIPCTVVIGPDGETTPAQRLHGLLALYGQWIDGQPGLATASQEMAPVRMAAMAMSELAYNGLVELLLRATRRGSCTESAYYQAVLRARLGLPHGGSPPSWPQLPRQVQRAWRSQFMLDLFPDNLPRFDFDARNTTWRILHARGLA